MTSFTKCPACSYTRQPTDDAPAWECPKCQKAYLKTAAREQQPSFATPPDVMDGEGMARTNVNSRLDPGNPEPYVREHFPYVDQWYRRFEAVFDASVFGDPVALKTKWTTAAVYSTVERYSRLEETGPGRVEFRATPGMKIFGLIFILAGITAAMANFSSRLPTGKMIGLFVISGVFVIAGILVLCKTAVPIVFDSLRGVCWIGKKSPDEQPGATALKDVIRLQDIHALQLIFWGGALLNTGRIGSGNQQRHYKCELNLVLHDGKRMHVAVANYFAREGLQADAATLAGFLGKPLWDATESTYRIFQQMRDQAACDQYFGPTA